MTVGRIKREAADWALYALALLYLLVMSVCTYALGKDVIERLLEPPRHELPAREPPQPPQPPQPTGRPGRRD